jgi:methionyl-tRNA formyltransferase
VSLRVVFMGTPDFAVPTLTEIIGQGHEVVAAYTRAPAPGGRRGLDLVESPVHRAASRFGIPVFTPKSLRKTEVQAEFAAHDADVAVVVAYGLILPKAVLDAPRLGCLNLHGSLLPRWRGAAPIQRAIMAGDLESGVMVMRMDEGLDTGPVAMAERVTITPSMTSGMLHDRLMVIGADLMARALAALERGSLHFSPQPEAGVTYAAKIGKDEARIDFSRDAASIDNLIRGLTPFPGAYFELPTPAGPRRIKVIRAEPVAVKPGKNEPGTVIDEALTIACGSAGSGGAIRILELQPAGKGAMSAEDFLRGQPVPPGTSVL